MTTFGVGKLTHLSASQENFLTQLNLDLGYLREVSGPVTRNRAAILEILNIDINLPSLVTSTMSPKIDFARIVKDVRAAVPCFEGSKDKNELFLFVTRLRTNLALYESLTENQKSQIILLCVAGKAEQIISSKVLTDPSIENDHEKILDVLVETFIPYKTSAAQAAYINDLKQGSDEQVTFFEARANIVVRHIKALEYKDLANKPGASDALVRAIDPTNYPTTPATGESEAEKGLKLQIKAIREERVREISNLMTQVLLRGIRPAIARRIIEQGAHVLTYKEILQKANDIEMSLKQKAGGDISEIHTGGEDDPEKDNDDDTSNSASVNPELDANEEINRIAERVAAINYSRRPRGNRGAFRGNFRGNFRGRNRGYGNFGRGNRGRNNYFRGRGRGNNVGNGQCLLCHQYGHWINECSYNPFRRKEGSNMSGSTNGSSYPPSYSNEQQAIGTLTSDGIPLPRDF